MFWNVVLVYRKTGSDGEVSSKNSKIVLNYQGIFETRRKLRMLYSLAVEESVDIGTIGRDGKPHAGESAVRHSYCESL